MTDVRTDRRVLDPPCVALQGETGSFSEQAAEAHWPNGVVLRHCAHFEEVIAALLEGETDWAVLPVENAIVGPVRPALAALESAPGELLVTAEVRVSVHLCLLGVPGAELSLLQEVHSHPVALAQCSRFLAAHPWIRPVANLDTAGAAREVGSRRLPTMAAIAGAPAAPAYGLVVLQESIQDRPDNWTRFVIVRKGMSRPQDGILSPTPHPVVMPL